MSASTLVTVFCDGPSCGWWDENHGTGDTAAEVRARLRTIGWKVGQPDPDGGRRRMDYCPDCKPETRGGSDE